MRPLYHPAASDITVQGILYALLDPVRVRIFVQLLHAECAKSCSAFLTDGKIRLPKSTLSQHFKILREAGLIRSERTGVELRSSVRCDDLKGKFEIMIRKILEAYQAEAAGARR